MSKNTPQPPAESNKAIAAIHADIVDSDMYYTHSSASDLGRTFLNEKPNISIRSDYTRDDYDVYRPGESQRCTPIEQAMKAYDKVGIVHNVIDLMADFTCKGIKLIHPNSTHERFFRQWWNYVNGDMISERFLNYLYRMGNVPVRRAFGQIPTKRERQWLSANGEKHVEPMNELVVEKRRIPIRYTFLNPLTLEVIEPELSLFTGRPNFALKLGRMVTTAISKIQNQYKIQEVAEALKYIPKEILDKVQKGETLIPIDPENISVFYYKKDDWDVWAKPMIYSIVDDLTMLEKFKLADMSALDGVISNVRLWSLGHITDRPETTFLPNKAMITKLRNILATGIAGGTLDLVWTPDLTFKESSTNTHNFLGITKYIPVLQSIYQGLGIPFSGGTEKAGATSGFIAMQTFVERLEYGRRVLVDFWNGELKRVQKAMGYTKPAIVTFDQINLGDDNNYKKLLIDLLDRDVVSVDTVLDNFKMFSEVEKIKIRRDYKSRESGKLPRKASVFHNPMIEDEFRKILLQSGGVVPSEIGLELEERKEGEKSVLELTQKHQEKIASQRNREKVEQKTFKPKKQNGRPKNSGDKSKRKKTLVTKKLSKGSEFLNTFLWANEAQKKISEIVTPIYLEQVNKKNVRSLSEAEFKDLEGAKLTIFSHASPFTEITELSVSELSKNTVPHEGVVYMTKALLSTFVKKNNREPIVEEMRQIQASAFAMCYEPEDTTESQLDAGL